MPKSGELEEACSGSKVLSLGCTRESLGEQLKVSTPKPSPDLLRLLEGPLYFLKLDK